MKTRMFLLAAALLMFASLGFSQPFAALLYNTDAPLMTACDGSGAPLPDGVNIEIYWDNDSNGPDADDPRPTVGEAVGNVNFNEFPVNGAGALGIPGGFLTNDPFNSVGITPVPARYYLRVHPAGLASYTSAVFTLAVGPQEVPVHVYECTPGVDLCTPEPAVVAFSRNPVPASQCAFLCPNLPTVVTVCPDPGAGPLDPTKPPILTVAPGCEPVVTNCDQQCPPLTAYQLIPIGYDAGCFYYSLTGAAEGCVCITLEGFLAASIESFTGVAGDGEVKLSWTTASESGVASYGIVRDGEVIGSVPSVNDVTTHVYEYTDATAENGTSYTYKLRVVNSDNTITETNFEVNASPSFSAALVTEYALHQNFPNPFNPSTSITFDVVEKNLVTLKVFNAAGQEVATVANGTFDSGRHIASFSADNMPSGLYFYTVKIGNEFNATKKMLLVK